MTVLGVNGERIGHGIVLSPINIGDVHAVLINTCLEWTHSDNPVTGSMLSVS